MAPLTCGTAAKMEAIAMITGIVSLFARGTPEQPPAVDPSTIFAAASAQRHPHLLAALTTPDQRAAAAGHVRQDCPQCPERAARR